MLNKNTNSLIKYLLLILALLFLAIEYNLFLVSNNLVTGGSGGLAIIISNYFKIPESSFVFIFSVITLILSFLFLGVNRSKSQIVTVFLLPLFISLTSNYGEYIDVTTNSMLVTVVVAAIISAFSTSIILKIGFTISGMSSICSIISKKLKIPYSKANLYINSVIVLLGGFIFGLDKVIYAIIFVAVESYVLNRLIVGISNSKAFYIVTEKYELVTKFILRELKHGYTELDGYSVKGDKKKKVIMCIVPTKEYTTLKMGIRMIDENAFFVIEDAYESFGVKNKNILG